MTRATHETLLYFNTAPSLILEALHYKPEGHRFDSRWCHCNFSLT